MKNTFTPKILGLLLLVCAMAFAGTYMTPLLMLLPVVLIYLGLCAGAVFTALGCALACAFTWLAGAQGALYGIFMFLPATLVLMVMSGNKMPHRSTVAALSLCFGTARYMYYCLPALLAGRGAFEDISLMLEQVSQLYVSFGNAMGVVLPDALPAYIADMAPQMTMIASIAPAMIFAFLNVLLLHTLGTKTQRPMRPMAPVYEWRLTRESLIGAGILAIGAIAVKLLSLKYAPAITAAIEVVILGEFAFNGFCYSEFIGAKVLGQSTTRRVLRYAFYILLMPYSLILLGVMGLTDCAFSMRARFTAPPKPPKE